MRFKPCILIGAALGIVSPAAVLAQSAEEPVETVETVEDTSTSSRFDISANVGVVSDYRFRGISLSDRDPAVQGGIDISMDNGLFVGTWASSVADTGGSNVEVDLYAGYGGSAAGLDYAVTALAYVYPGGDGVNYYEFNAGADKTIGPASVGVLVAYVPDQTNFPGDNLYISGTAGLGVPGTPISLNARVGREASEFSKKWDWELGASYSRGPFTASLVYVDTDFGGPAEAGRLGQGSVVASLIATF